MKVRVIAGVVVVIALYITTIALYASTGLGHPASSAKRRRQQTAPP